ncbi:Golgin candidate 5 [Sesamum angolense]|uniref:Golgin candidate 5 n=1 Tax=Sesamum angolense TaxID=2727404 RepID=A0AAE1XEL6_9LAMI|nr:Golgin candidate 5 [Sesamum angolense]
MASVVARLPSPPLVVVNGRKSVSGTLQKLAMPSIKERQGCRGVKAKATGEGSETFNCQVRTECYRVGLIGLGFAGVVGFWASINLVAAIDKLPVFPSVLELIGILYSTWFTYRYLLFKPDRQELSQAISKSISDILGRSGSSCLIEDMAWFSGKVSLGNFPDFAGAVNKLSESVKNIEKNFDSALGLEEKSDATGSDSEAASGLWPTDRKALLEPIIGFMGQKGEESTVESLETSNASKSTSPVRTKQVEDDDSTDQVSVQIPHGQEANEEKDSDVKTGSGEEIKDTSEEPKDNAAADNSGDTVVLPPTPVPLSEEKPEEVKQTESANLQEEERRKKYFLHYWSRYNQNLQIIFKRRRGPAESRESSASNIPDKITDAEDEMEASKEDSDLVKPLNDTAPMSIELKQHLDKDANAKEQRLSTGSNSSDFVDSVAELEKVKKEMKMMETALHGAARQAQAKADEIAKLMNENEQLKAVIDDLREETDLIVHYSGEDTLRREQSKKSDAAALLKEKDEIITQVMAEGEELSKKQAAQESQIRKLRAQIRELEEEKKGLLTKLQVEENKVDSIKKDKAATEKLLQETVEKHQAELATQKEYYTNALNVAKEAEALAEARADTEARIELESRLTEAEDRESMLVQTLEELRQTLSRKEQQDIEDLQKRYQASERRCEELITQVPESTRPLLRQIEAMQETASRRAEAWAAVERSLNSRLQEAETKAAAAEEKERSINERLTQTLSRINVLEAQISCLRAEQTANKISEKERQRAAENRQEYLALKEEADTHESRAHQLEEEIRELRRKHKEELHEALMHQELLQKELERERAARLDQERASSAVPDQSPRTSQAQLHLIMNCGEGAMSPYYMKSVTSSTFEAALRQKEGELASYASRLASMESIRDSLAEELVKMTAQLEELRADIVDLKEMYREQIQRLSSSIGTDLDDT